jgi:hypothetical protein
VRAACFVLAVAAGVGCGGGSDDAAETSTDDSETGAPVAVELTDDELAAIADEVADVVPIDRRPSVLAELGGPDAFAITVDEVDGVVSRFESWSYYEAGTQIDFVDGELLWDIEIAGVPDGSFLPLMFDPMEFTMLTSRAEVTAALGDVELTRVTADTDLTVDGAELWTAEQLVLAFVDDRLVYAETFVLAIGGQEIAT